LQGVFSEWIQPVAGVIEHGGRIIMNDCHSFSKEFSLVEKARFFWTPYIQHFSHITQTLDLWVGLFKIIYFKERKLKGMKGEARKSHHALLAFCKGAITPAARWGFERTGLLVDADNIRNPIQIGASIILDRISVPAFNDVCISPSQMREEAANKNATHKRTPIPKSNQFIIRMVVCIKVATGTCPRAGREEEEEEEASNKEESDPSETISLFCAFRLVFVTLSTNDS
jgi:hypothetical protein